MPYLNARPRRSNRLLALLPLAVTLVLATGCPGPDGPDVVQPDDDVAPTDTDEMDGGGTGGDADGGMNGGDSDGGMGEDGSDGFTGPDVDCSDNCTIGSTKCDENGFPLTCVPDADGCGMWGEPQSKCMGENVCQNGRCVEPDACTDNDCAANARCVEDDSTNGYSCMCNSRNTDYLGDGTICLPDFYSVVPAGQFQMGSPSGETGRESDETRHAVEITRPLAVQKHEVVQSGWGAVMQNGAPWNNSSLCTQTVCPVYNVSWWDAVKYANELSADFGLEKCYTLDGCSGTPGNDYSCSKATFKGLDCKGWRLPTEAEWEYTARAGTDTATYAGDLSSTDADPNVASIGWYKDNANGKPHVHVLKDRNDWKLADTSGNVAEWVWDRYGSYDSGEQTDPTGADSGAERVVRGGHWDSNAAACRSAARDKRMPSTRSDKVGFRVVRTLPTKN